MLHTRDVWSKPMVLPAPVERVVPGLSGTVKDTTGRSRANNFLKSLPFEAV